MVIDRNNKVRELSPACCPVTQLVGRSGGTGGRGAALGHGPSGGSMSDGDAAGCAGPMLDGDAAG